MRRFSLTVITTFLFLGAVLPVYSDPPLVFVELAHTDWLYLCGDSVDDANYPFNDVWLLLMNLRTPDTVSDPRIDFTSSRNFTDFTPWPTSVTPPSTYVWDYSGDSLTVEQPGLVISAAEGLGLRGSGLTATRSVDNAVLTNDVTTQTVDFVLRFKEPIPVEVNQVRVQLGMFPFESHLVEETVISQNNVAGWLTRGDGLWVTHPAFITVDVDYNFQAQIQCAKRAEYQGTTIYHRPQASVSIGQWNVLPFQVGTSVSLAHPEGETAKFQLSESVIWDCNTSLNRKDICLVEVSVQVDSNGLDVSEIEMLYGKRHDSNGVYSHDAVSVEVAGKNIISAKMTTPVGREWSMWLPWSYQDDSDRLSLEMDYLTSEDLEDLGITSGTYQFEFRDHLGTVITTSSDAELFTPAQVPNITSPAHGAEDIEPDAVISWDQVLDPDVDEIRLKLMDYQQSWFSRYSFSPNWESVLVTGMSPRTGIVCDLLFCDSASEVSPEGINLVTTGCNLQGIQFFTGSFKGDFDTDDDVDMNDLRFFALHWLNSGCDDSAGDQSDWCYGTDIDKSGEVNFCDFAKLGKNWRRCIRVDCD